MHLFGEILRRMENLREKIQEREVLMDVWLAGGVEKNVVRLGCFLPEPTKTFSPQNA